MPSVISFTGAYGALTGGSFLADNTAGTITADLADGAISVGDAVTISGFDAAVKSLGNVSDNTAFYLGQGIFDGKIGHVSGDDAIVGNNNGFFIVFNVPLTGSESADVVAFATSPTSLNNVDASCFAKGTLIAMPSGERAVETLRIGDLVTTPSGRTVAVMWLGCQTISTLFGANRVTLVRIRAGALGNGLPHTDLTVTGDHGMILDGLVINASALVNGGSIDFVPLADLPESLTVYHIETEAHDVILANGAPAETFVDVPGRRAFDNYPEYLDLYGAERLIPEMPRPRISAQRLVPDAIKARLGIAEDLIGWEIPLSA